MTELAGQALTAAIREACLTGISIRSVDDLVGSAEAARAQWRSVADQFVVPNDASIVRLVGAMLLDQNDEWTGCRVAPCAGTRT